MSRSRAQQRLLLHGNHGNLQFFNSWRCLAQLRIFWHLIDVGQCSIVLFTADCIKYLVFFLYTNGVVFLHVDKDIEFVFDLEVRHLLGELNGLGPKI